MAEQPTDPRWPPSDDIDFEAVLARLMVLKRHHWPEHTARDPSDPFIQLLRLVAALGQHGLQRINHALKQFDPKTATSRRALISLLEPANRPLLPAQPARGSVYAKLSAGPVVDTVVIEKGTRIIQPGTTDPIFSVDENISTGSSVDFSLWFWDVSADTVTATPTGTARSVHVGDGWIIGFDGLQFDSVAVTMNLSHTGNQTYCLEYYNEEWGTPNTVTDLTTQLRFKLNDYLHADTVGLSSIVGLMVTVKCKSTNTTEKVAVTSSSGNPVALTSLLGQVSVTTSVSDYEVLAEWRPIASPTDGTDDLVDDGTISFNITSVRSEDDWWAEHSIYGYAIRLRHVVDVSGSLPEDVTFTDISIGEGSFYATAPITQGYTSTFTLAQTDGTAFQLIPLASDPIGEPVEDPTVTITVGGDADWSIVDDLSNSGSSSKHAILREDVDDGWGIMFGDGSVGVLPDPGASVRVTYRTGSIQAGDLDADTTIKSISSTGLAKNWVLPRGTSGYEAEEASTREDVLRFRASIIPQLALRAESVVTPSEIETALSGGAPNRATFRTEDGRTPFSRALWTAEGAGDRQYRVIVVGDDSDADGAVAVADATEAEEWLNGTTIGVQTVGGHGPQNTEAVVTSFVARTLLPTITVEIGDVAGIREQVDQIVRGMIKPHAVDDDGEWRWYFGGRVPVAVLFGRLWDGLPGRDLITITISDGTTTYGIGDSILLEDMELPVLDSTYTATACVTVSES